MTFWREATGPICGPKSTSAGTMTAGREHMFKTAALWLIAMTLVAAATAIERCSSSSDPPDSNQAAVHDRASGFTVRRMGERVYRIELPRDEIPIPCGFHSPTGTSLVPAFEDGKAIGFKLFSVRPESLCDEIGLRQGDLITAINGFSLADPGKVFDLYAELERESLLVVQLRRGEQSFEVVYHVVRWPLEVEAERSALRP